MEGFETYERAMAQLRHEGLDDHAMSLVLMGMTEAKLDYDTALGVYRDWKAEKGLDWPVQRWNSEFAYRCVKAGLAEGPGPLLTRLAKEESHED